MQTYCDDRGKDGNPEVGRKAALETEDEIKAALSGADRQLRFEILDEEYEELIERARKIDAAQRERMEYLKKHDKKEYKRIMTMRKFSCGL